jgi:hypothetical protein
VEGAKHLPHPKRRSCSPQTNARSRPLMEQYNDGWHLSWASDLDLEPFGEEQRTLEDFNFLVGGAPNASTLPRRGMPLWLRVAALGPSRRSYRKIFIHREIPRHSSPREKAMGGGGVRPSMMIRMSYGLLLRGNETQGSETKS